MTRRRCISTLWQSVFGMRSIKRQTKSINSYRRTQQDRWSFRQAFWKVLQKNTNYIQRKYKLASKVRQFITITSLWSLWSWRIFSSQNCGRWYFKTFSKSTGKFLLTIQKYCTYASSTWKSSMWEMQSIPDLSSASMSWISLICPNLGRISKGFTPTKDFVDYSIKYWWQNYLIEWNCLKILTSLLQNDITKWFSQKYERHYKTNQSSIFWESQICFT